MDSQMFHEARCLLDDVRDYTLLYDQFDSAKANALKQRLADLEKKLGLTSDEIRGSVISLLNEAKNMLHEDEQDAQALADELNQDYLSESGQEMLDRAAAKGQIKLVEWFLNHTQVKPSENAMDSAAFNGHLDVMKLLRGPCTVAALKWSATHGRQDIVEWLLENYSEQFTQKFIDHALDCAIGEGHLELAETLREKYNGQCSPKGLYWAIDNSDPTAVEWVMYHYPGMFTDEVFERALSIAAREDKEHQFNRKKIHTTLEIHRDVSRTDFSQAKPVEVKYPYWPDQWSEVDAQ